MKILHVFNTAGVSNVLNKYLNEYSYIQSKCITRLYNDSYGIARYYNDKIFNRRNEIFLLWLIKNAHKFDIIHFHSIKELAYKFKRLFRKKPVIMSYHGTDIRYKWTYPEIVKMNNLFDFISVSTTDLLFDIQPKLNKDVHHIVNAVDTNHFKECYPTTNKTLFLNHKKGKNNGLDLALNIAEKNKLELIVLNILKERIIYHDMPQFLSQFQNLIDVKVDKERNVITNYSLSYTALQFLSLSIGRNVFKYTEKIVCSPSRKISITRNQEIIRNWIKIYEELL